MTDEAKALVERLRYQGYLNSDNGDWGFRNPDGPAAADLIETQAREIERLREALENIGNLSTNGCIKVDTPLGMYVGTPDAYAREIMGMPWRNTALAGDSHDQ